MISRRRIRGWIALLLPLMLLRALLPAGYMPVAAQDGLHIVMCSDGLADRTAPAPGPDHSPTPDGSHCLFAHAAAFAPPQAAAAIVTPAPVAFSTAPDPVSGSTATGPPRLHTARGPPRHS